jgi:REP element-mobilizing transposase RayT
MAYNPKIHHRRSIRLKGYDYSKAGAYFITLCCQDMKHRFGKIENGEMILNENGKIAYNEWAKLPSRFPNMELDVFQIMPNHIHGILIVVDAPVGTPLAGVQNIINENCDVFINENCDVFINENCDETIGAGASPARTTIGDIVGAYKSLVFNACLDIYKSKNERMGKLWLRNYYEIIIRNEFSYQNISNYIINNPAKWKEDKFNK